MPYEESKCFKTPSRSEPLWRYMAIDKFFTMLNDKSLYFPNITKFKEMTNMKEHYHDKLHQ